MIKAVLFDIGGVLTTSPFDGIARYEREHDLPEGLIRRINSTNPDSNAWAMLERGALSVASFEERFRAEAAALGYAVDPQAILASLRGRPRSEVIEAVAFCRVHYKTAALTNNFVPSVQLGWHRGDRVPFDDLFDLVIESSKVGVRKPDRRVYEFACEALGVQPHQVVFLDDLGVNLKPARAMGMTTIKVHDGAQAVSDLYSILGVAPEGWVAPAPTSVG